MYKCLYCDRLFDEPKIVRDRVSREITYTCPYCGELSYDEAVRCCVCGEYEYERKACRENYEYLCEKCYEEKENYDE